MSLFKVRDFWSFDINHFSKLSAPQDSIEEDEDNSVAKDVASSVISVGRFNSIGKYDVFVCGGLNGLVCIIQVPKNEQPSMVEDEDANKETEMVEDENSFANRQLLAVHQVGFPISDLKCGFYTSALKQSIAILSFDKLVVYQVKKQQVDLLTSSPIDLKGSSLDESLFSHKLEENYRFELLTSEIAINILTISNHSEGSLTEPAGSDQHSKVTSANQGRFNKVLILPQRDVIIIQYTNHLIFTLIDHKKIIGHFKLLCPSPYSHVKTSDVKHAEQEYQVQQMAQYVGSMPMAYMKDQSTSFLLVTTSDRKIYCLSIDKMTAQAKQNVMKIVAHTLLQDKTSKVSTTNHSNAIINDESFKGEKDEKIKIEIELDSFATWTSDLICAPLHIQAIHRCLIGTAHSSQLVVMSRYSLDLISGGSGAHLWSHRFENPLICFSSYSLEHDENKDINQTEGRGERLISLICADNLSCQKCNLLILEEDQLVWSASLNSRPVQLWRVSLSRVPGALAALDINGDRLCISYLGTNLAGDEVQLLNSSEEEKEVNDIEVSILETLDEQISTGNQELDGLSKKGEKSQRLTFEVRLDASNQWPNVKVNSCISLKPESTSHRVLQDIVVTLEFDDLLDYEMTDNFQTTYLSNSTIQVQLGSCWPDCREPIHLSGCFSLRPQASADLCLLPKTLKVNLIVKFNEIYIGTTIQEESFILPMNLVTQLVHIDYSTGQNQSLNDVQANLNPYKRSVTNEDGDQNKPSYYLCDICINDQRGILNLIDEFIESDLICRGINSESKEGILRLLGNNSNLDNLNTMENLDLLAQSLDCRLRYKSLSKSARQTSEEQLPLVIVSIAFKIANGPKVLQGIEEDIAPVNQLTESYSVVWLHLCDLTASGTVIPEEIVKQHSRDWKTIGIDPCRKIEINDNSSSILITIEGDYPIPVLFIYSHVIERLRKRELNLSNVCLEVYPLDESTSDALDINFSEGLKIHNWFAISRNLHNKMVWFLKYYETALKDKQIQLKEELDKEYYKFHISVMTSISMSKRLYNLPSSMLKQFNYLSSLTKKYQLNLIKLLSELENLEHLEYHYSKIPNTFNIVTENDDSWELFSSRLAGLINKE